MFAMAWLVKAFANPAVRFVALSAGLCLLVLGSYRAGLEHQDRLWKATMQRYQLQQRDAQQESDRLLGHAQDRQNQIVAGLQQDAAAAEAEQQRVQVIVREVPKYVTRAADTHAVITAGAVWLFNQSVAAENPGLTLPASGKFNVDAPSGVALSTFAAVAAGNNAECVERGKVIGRWASWYVQNQQVIDDLNATLPASPAIPMRATP